MHVTPVAPTCRGIGRFRPILYKDSLWAVPSRLSSRARWSAMLLTPLMLLQDPHDRFTGVRYIYQSRRRAAPRPFQNETRGAGRDTVSEAGGSGSQAPSIHWCASPKSRLGPVRPPFTSEASARAGALLQSRVHILATPGRKPPPQSPGSATVGNRRASRDRRLGGGRCVRDHRNPSRKHRFVSSQNQHIVVFGPLLARST